MTAARVTLAVVRLPATAPASRTRKGPLLRVEPLR